MRGRITVESDVDLDDFREEITKYALNNWGMFENLSDFDTEDLVEECLRRNIDIPDYTNVNIVLQTALDKIMPNLDIIDIADLEALILKYNL